MQAATNRATGASRAEEWTQRINDAAEAWAAPFLNGASCPTPEVI